MHLKLSLAVIVIATLLFFSGWSPKSKSLPPKSGIAKLPDNIRVVSDPIQLIESNINFLPDGFTKNSLYIVLVAHKTSSEQELNEILQTYAKLKIAELDKQSKAK